MLTMCFYCWNANALMSLSFCFISLISVCMCFGACDVSFKFIVVCCFISAALLHAWSTCKMATLVVNHWTVKVTVASVMSSICYWYCLKALHWVHHWPPSSQLMEPWNPNSGKYVGVWAELSMSASCLSSKNAQYLSLSHVSAIFNETKKITIKTRYNKEIREIRCWHLTLKADKWLTCMRSHMLICKKRHFTLERCTLTRPLLLTLPVEKPGFKHIPLHNCSSQR